MKWWLGAGGVSLVAFGLIAWYVTSGNEKESPPLPPAGRPATKPDAGNEARKSPDDWFDSVAAEKLSRRFLEAAAVEDILPLVRDADRVGPLIRAAHPDGKINPEGLQTFGASDLAVPRGRSSIFVPIETGAFEKRWIPIVRTRDGMKIDWEGWTGRPGIPWEDFVTVRPREAVVMRVRIQTVDYYNLSFSDDSRWKSYQITSPDGEHVLYGYVERGSALHGFLGDRLSGEGVERMVSLAIHFPPGENTRDQVVIDRLVSEDWVIEEPSP